MCSLLNIKKQTSKNVVDTTFKVFKTLDVEPKKLNHVFNDDKYYCLLFIYMKQLSLSSYMTVRKTLHIKS